MAQIHIPESLLSAIERILPPSVSVEDFILQAVREKLAFEDQKREFYRLSDRIDLAMTEQGLSEADILRDFESHRSEIGP
jgi:hypothetical protein